MAVIRFRGVWTPDMQDGLSTDLIALRPNEDYIKKVNREKKRLEEYQNKAGKIKDLDVTIEVHYRKRSLDSNALMWATYEIESHELSGGRVGAGMVRPEEIYEQDLEEFAPRVRMVIPVEQADIIKRYYRKIHSVEVHPQNPEYAIIVAIVTSSMFSTIQMSKWIDMRFDRLAEYNVCESADIEHYWKEFKLWQDKKGHRIVDDDETISGTEYKLRVKRCEACGIPLIHEGGSLAHIQARGMGGNPVAEKDKPSNWLHLCDPHHMMFDNGQGRSRFVRSFPHLKNKIEGAVKKQVTQQEKNDIIMIGGKYVEISFEE